tara:strand:- start:52102 stop:54078 length:1977 start_codon:yes stop_codon:yes gene_type:complete
MESLLIYLFKSAGLLSLFYILYVLLLKNDTAFTANRKFLIGGILASLILPAIYFTKTVIIKTQAFTYTDSLSNYNVTPAAEVQPTDWWLIAGSTYLLISGFFILQLLFRLFLISRTIRENTSYKQDKYRIIETTQQLGPYSFFKYIFLNSKSIPKNELELMLKHEKVHADQYHSADMLFANILTSVLWFNPLSWLYRKIIEQNLEFIADHETVNASECIQHYQHVLVKVSTSTDQPALVNHFYQSFIKKRIVMLNKKSSNTYNLSKMSLIFPLLLAFMLCFNVKTEAQVKKVTKVEISNVQFFPDLLASAIITPSTTKEMLEDISIKFKEYGMQLQFKNLKYSKRGLLTGINVNFENKENEESGNYNKSGDAPIDPFEITLFEDLKIEFKSPDPKNEKQAFVFVTDSNIVVLDSVNTPKNKIWKNSLGDVTTERIIVSKSSKNNPDYSFSVANNVQYYATNGDTIKTKGKVLNRKSKNGNRITWVEKDSLPSKQGFKISDTMHVYQVKNLKGEALNISSQKNQNLLIIIDGKEMPKAYDINKINPETIKSMNVIKGKAGALKYGDKARDGVIEINTKNEYKEDIIAYEGNTKNPNMFVISPYAKDLLVVVDGKIKKSDFDMDSINPDEIKSVVVWKGKSAIKKYGKQGEKGVVEITLK